VRPPSQTLPTVQEVEIPLDEEDARDVLQHAEKSNQPSSQTSSTVVPDAGVASIEDRPQDTGHAADHTPSHKGSTESESTEGLVAAHEMSIKETALKARCEKLSDRCWKCEKHAAQSLPRQDLKMCGACAAIGRTIRYCSRECQVDDWKKGSTSHCAHKLICGKPLSDYSSLDVLLTAEVIVKVPLPDRGFKRSPALLHLISFLERPDTIDYVFIYPPEEEKLVIFPPFAGLGTDRDMFLAMRQRALRNGDPSSVKTMYHLLRPWAELLAYPDFKLKKQLRDEYNVDVDRVNSRPADPSPELAMVSNFPGVRIMVTS